jgi:3-deoxy-D-manno-octulosonic-acid transferase
MVVFYNISLWLVTLVIRIASPFHEKARLFVAGRKKLIQRIAHTFATNQAPVLWVHCASLGEFEQGRPVIESLKKQNPTIKVLLTFFSPSGYEVRKNYTGADYVFYLPMDTPGNARQFVNLTKPTVAIFVKYEFWYHYTKVLAERKIPIISISSIFRPDQLFFRSYGGFYRRILKRFSRFFVQNDSSVKLLRGIGLTNCERAGDTRFDRVYDIVRNGEDIAIATRFKANEKVMVAGSCWKEDLEVLVPLINEKRLKFIIAPHEVTEEFISEIERSLQVDSIRFSNAGEENLDDVSVLIIDNIGMLSRLYRYGEFAYVGGGFGKGLHNILEAACYGLPVFFGNKNYKKFQEAIDLINLGGAYEISDYTDLKAKYEMLNQPENFMLACEVTQQYVKENLGATSRIVNYCNPLLRS